MTDPDATATLSLTPHDWLATVNAFAPGALPEVTNHIAWMAARAVNSATPFAPLPITFPATTAAYLATMASTRGIRPTVAPDLDPAAAVAEAVRLIAAHQQR